MKWLKTKWFNYFVLTISFLNHFVFNHFVFNHFVCNHSVFVFNHFVFNHFAFNHFVFNHFIFNNGIGACWVIECTCSTVLKPAGLSNLSTLFEVLWGSFGALWAAIDPIFGPSGCIVIASLRPPRLVGHWCEQPVRQDVNGPNSVSAFRSRFPRTFSQKPSKIQWTLGEKLAKSIKNRQIYFKIQYKMDLKSAKIALWDPLGGTLSKTPRVDASRVRPGPS